ncbi:MULTISPECIES: amino acid ABC transporter permease [unclassified Phenylobacterium]|uniref:amino acid ABC transporter permease n=1 Tax=unclassified Phenylobacterium TaxID=2640670 RepID=UPI000839E9F8|nr:MULTISPECIES: amino acid ABC transporter permease [unclassified Phenylobacterium]
MADTAILGPPRTPSGAAVLGKRLFGSPLNAVLTLLVVWAVASAAAPLIRWAVLDAVLFPAEPAACRDARGACWSFVAAKGGQILFGIYPIEERWRPMLVSAALLVLLGYSLRPAAWRPRLAALWALVLPGALLLMFGGFAGLSYVATTMWGGLPVTLILTVTAVGGAFPLAVLLALGRRSELPAIRILATLFIELTRALPLLSILFIASILLPLLVPEWLLPDKFFRAMIALLLFAAAYLAEVVRGGLQALPSGQTEAAQGLGLGYWQTQRLVVLPQALALVIPSLTNTIIVMIKNTSLVLVVGLFDLISSGRAALADPEWSSPAMETYLFIAAIYFGLCFGFGRFAQALERHTRTEP